MLMYKRLLVVVLAACICLLLAACGEDEPDAAAPAEEARPLPSPQITQTAVPTATALPPTPSAVSPTPSAIPPTPTVEPTSLPATPDVSSTPTATPVPDPTPDPTPTTVPPPTPLPKPVPTPAPSPALTPTPEATPSPADMAALNFTGVRVVLREPSQVQAIFSLRDQDGNPAILPAAELQQATRIFGARCRCGRVGRGRLHGNQLICALRRAFCARGGVRPRLHAQHDHVATAGRHRRAAPLCVQALESALDRLPEAHRVGVVAFHDRSAEPVIIAFPTTDRDLIRAEVARFAESGFDPGSSRLWDAVERGLDLFSAQADTAADVTRALVFLSDGRDTSSLRERHEVGLLAQDRNVQLYPLGLGDVYQESDLRALATTTNGAYYAVAELAQLETQFIALVNDFAGQYKLSYTTLRRDGEYAVRIETTLDGVTGVFASDALPFGEIYSPDTQGRIAVDPLTIDVEEQIATTFVRALHVPRNIQHFRFTLDIDRPCHSLTRVGECRRLAGRVGTLATR